MSPRYSRQVFGVDVLRRIFEFILIRGFDHAVLGVRAGVSVGAQGVDRFAALVEGVVVNDFAVAVTRAARRRSQRFVVLCTGLVGFIFDRSVNRLLFAFAKYIV